MLLLFSLSLSANAQPLKDPTPGCIDSLLGKPQFEFLRGKMDLASPQKQTLEMLSNEKKASKQDKVGISKLSTEIDECAIAGRIIREQIYHPLINVAVNDYLFQVKEALADLYSNKSSYGNFATTYASLDRKLGANATEIISLLNARKEAEVKKEAEAKVEKEYQLKQLTQQREQQAQQNELQAQREARELRELSELREQREQQQRALNAQIEAQNRNAAIGLILQNQRNVANQQQQNMNNYMQSLQKPIFTPPISTNCLPNGAGGFNCSSR